MASTATKQTITTVRVRPARDKVLTELGLDPNPPSGPRRLAEVTVFGQPVAVVEDDGSLVKLVNARFDHRQIEKTVKAAFSLMNTARECGLMDRGER